MNRILSVAIVLPVAIPLFARNRASHKPEEMFIATTGRIMAIDDQAKTMKVRGSEDFATCKLDEMSWNHRQRIEVTTVRIKVPVSITTAFTQTTGKRNQSKSTSSRVSSLDEYTVATTRDTVFQDHADSIRFEDFKNCETISIHGLFKGTTLTALRIAKWD